MNGEEGNHKEEVDEQKNRRQKDQRQENDREETEPHTEKERADSALSLLSEGVRRHGSDTPRLSVRPPFRL